MACGAAIDDAGYRPKEVIMGIVTPFAVSPHARLSRRTLLGSLGAAGAATLLPTAAFAQPAEVAAMGTVIRFRYLSQRFAKAYCCGLLDVDASRTDQVMTATRQAMTRYASELTPMAATSGARAELEQVLRLAREIGTPAVKPATPAAAQAVSKHADSVVQAASNAALALEKIIARPGAKLLNVSGTQRFMSQRMAKNYFLQAAGIDAAAAGAALNADVAAFRSGMATLAAAPISTPGIRGELELAQAQWMLFEASLSHRGDKSALRDILTTSERLLEVMDKLTALYEEALRSVA
ncbi:type IV pili methyl-accepting chemotaxis transducer N-terminal domain-containing protein [Ottowia testudinis]|uniref:Type IV pili methyl-accepting chemotaxis transducer N-terminal domain-containing protein n=1 Tax=Ottowia testudinis TaxID=2816950 RepID=A0A975CCM0_9BURK|nr:type IV pili methyl-accepting chemotaxis transducer N-terminal domain-containing protein [Ottowia testudinis]QTD43925.1 type IV pili methyl-accepting chemotaxis transducer N-terminal domain-containing protein [Ottowia testudinis]